MRDLPCAPAFCFVQPTEPPPTPPKPPSRTPRGARAPAGRWQERAAKRPEGSHLGGTLSLPATCQRAERLAVGAGQASPHRHIVCRLPRRVFASLVHRHYNTTPRGGYDGGAPARAQPTALRSPCAPLWWVDPSVGCPSSASALVA